MRAVYVGVHTRPDKGANPVRACDRCGRRREWKRGRDNLCGDCRDFARRHKELDRWAS